jgi:hypothetical protein
LFGASTGEADGQASRRVQRAAGAAAGGLSAAKAPGEDAAAHDLLQRRQVTQCATTAVNESVAVLDFHLYG